MPRCAKVVAKSVKPKKLKKDAMLSLSSAFRCQSTKAIVVSIFIAVCVWGGQHRCNAQHTHCVANGPTRATPQCERVCLRESCCTGAMLYVELTMKLTTMHAQISSTNTSNDITTYTHTRVCVCVVMSLHTQRYTVAHRELTQMSLLGHGSSWGRENVVRESKRLDAYCKSKFYFELYHIWASSVNILERVTQHALMGFTH